MAEDAGLSIVLVILILLAARGTIPGAPLSPAAGRTSSSALASAAPVAWHPIFRMPGTPYAMVVDAPRARILVTAQITLANGTTSWNLFVLNYTGAVQANVSFGLRLARGSPYIAVDSLTGIAYLSATDASIFRVDPAAGLILNHWTADLFGLGPAVLAVHGSLLYADAFGIREINATTGAYLGILSYEPMHPRQILTDPSGRWIFGLDWYGVVTRVDATNGSVLSIGDSAVSLAFSADGRRLFVCTYAPNPLMWYWLANGTYEGGGVCDGGMIASNPVTGVLGNTEGRLLTPTGIVADLHRPLWDLGWSTDGHTLFGLSDSMTTLEVSTWSGSPTLIPPSPYLNPHVGSLSVALETTSGFNGTTVSTYIDGGQVPSGAMTPITGSLVLDLTPLSDGTHTFRATGWDALGQPLDATFSFTTDGTPPRITVLSPVQTATVPYVLSGQVNETHLLSLQVDGVNASLAGNDWSETVALVIGDNSFSVVAMDTFGNVGGATVLVRYWPVHLDNLTDTSAHIAVSVPPSWNGATDTTVGGVHANIGLLGPSESPAAATLTIVATPKGDLVETTDYAMSLASQSATALQQQGAILLSLPVAENLDGHPAASFEATESVAGVPTHIVQVIVVSGAWKEAFVLTFTVPTSNWARYQGTWAWILEGFHIETQAGPLGIDPLVLGILGVAWAITAAGVLLWIRRPRKPREEHPALPKE